MGVVSRKVIPACGRLCFFCPALRARSRQPVKRYKKLIADIFPRSQDAEPNDRKIGKLCDYASKNPLRLPKITDNLDQRFYKYMRNEQFGSVKVVLLIYRKLFSSCKEHMPLFANSLLGIVRTLLEQPQYNEMQILGCSVLVDFINGQLDSAYMFILEGLIPKLCQLAREAGDDDRTVHLRSAGMQVLAVMVEFMGKNSHISMDFDHIITVTLENYMETPTNLEHEILEANSSSLSDINKKSLTSANVMNPMLEMTVEAAKNPSFWSRVCLYYMAQLAKEATTIRRVLEPLFSCFDSENHWSQKEGLALSVLAYLQALLEESGESSHLLLSILIKHLDHKNVVKQRDMQINILEVTAQLAINAKQKASVAIIGALSDLVKHLKKCIVNSFDLSLKDGSSKCNKDLQVAVEKCISRLSNKVADVGPILDMMGVVLENIPTSTTTARATIFAVNRTSQIISSVPNVTYHKKAFPDDLFHHLLLAMAHSDHEVRAGAHHIFSTVLMPSLSSLISSVDRNFCRTYSEQSPNPSRKLKFRSFSVVEGSDAESEILHGGVVDRELQVINSLENHPSKGISEVQLSTLKDAEQHGKKGLTSLRVSSHQISLLLSTIWVQAISAENSPANYEAMAHTFAITLLFSRSKSSSCMALVQHFQLAFSLRSISLESDGVKKYDGDNLANMVITLQPTESSLIGIEITSNSLADKLQTSTPALKSIESLLLIGGLQPSQRRSLFTLASYMLIFLARACNLPVLVPVIKSSLTNETVDPYIQLDEDIRLQALSTSASRETKHYGSHDDEVAALKSLSAIQPNDQQLKELVISHFITKYRKLSEDELSSIKIHILERFSPDDAFSLGGPLFMETPCPSSPIGQIEFQSIDEMMASAGFTDDDSFLDASGSQSGRKASLSFSSLDVLGVNQLLESVLETAHQVASYPVPSTPMPYDQVKNECEALVSGKQQKMLALQSFKLQREANTLLLTDENGSKGILISNTALDPSDELNPPKIEANQGRLCSQECVQEQSFRLPPSSPYDKFLKAAGC